MPLKSIPRVVRYEPSLKETLPLNSVVEIKGIKLKVSFVDESEATLIFADDNPSLYVLEDGRKMNPDEWFETYIYALTDSEVNIEDSGENKADSISDDEGRESEAEFPADRDAGEREDDARSVLTKAFDFHAE